MMSLWIGNDCHTGDDGDDRDDYVNDPCACPMPGNCGWVTAVVVVVGNVSLSAIGMYPTTIVGIVLVVVVVVVPMDGIVMMIVVWLCWVITNGPTRYWWYSIVV